MSPAEVLMRLFNAAITHFAAIAQAMGGRVTDGNITIEQAQALIDKARDAGVDLYVDYLHGRVMKVKLDERPLYVALYDRDHGQGAAARALGVEVADG